MYELDEIKQRPFIFIRDRRILLVIGFLLVLLILGAGWYFFTPKVISVYPPNDQSDTLSASTIQITFNQEMNTTILNDLLLIEPAVSGSYTWVDRSLVFTPDAPWPADTKISYRLSPQVKSSLGLPVINGASWRFSIKHAWLVYLINHNGKSELYRLDPTGEETIKLIDAPSTILDYQSHLDGRHILYAMLQGRDTEIRLADLETKSDSLLYTCPKTYCYQVALSKDLLNLAFVMGAIPETGVKSNSSTWLLALNELQPQGDPIRVAAEDHITRDISWSPSGWLAFYDDTSKGFTFFHPSDGESKNLPNDTGEAGSWSPTNDVYYFSEILFNDSVDPTAPQYYSRLSSYSLDTGQTQVVLTNDQSEDVAPIVSSDGNLIAFGRRFLNSKDWTPGRQLWTIRIDGSDPRSLTDDPMSTQMGFSWSPDSSQIAYTSFNTASLTSDRELWIADVKTGFTRKLLVDAYNLQWLD